MIMMKCNAPAPCKLLGIGDFLPGKEYPLPDAVAAELIATRDPNWERVGDKGKYGGEDHSGNTGNKGRK